MNTWVAVALIVVGAWIAVTLIVAALWAWFFNKVGKM